jgi:dTDP-4-dehydrorhamnose reductase
MIKQIINEQDPKSRSLAIEINSYFPKKLNEYFNRSHTPILTIGTDCVYSGKSGKYSEAHRFDAKDIYGKSKILGEKGCNNTLILRSSIVGRDKRKNNSLLEWVLSQPKSGVIEGYVNHLWNGLTTLHFAKIISGVIENSRFEPTTLHVVPRNTVSKFDLIKIIANEFGRSDLKILKSEAANFTDRTLSTTDPKRNRILWEQAGYEEIPTVEQMIEEYRLEITTHSK